MKLVLTANPKPFPTAELQLTSLSAATVCKQKLILSQPCDLCLACNLLHMISAWEAVVSIFLVHISKYPDTSYRSSPRLSFGTVDGLVCYGM